MTVQKRLFDVVFALILIVLLAPIGMVVALVLLLTEGAPVFFVSERMKTPDQGFRLVKFRTMRPAATNGGVTGGDKSDRISPVQRFLRRSRLDELPQLWNVLRGDMSFVGPRPPLRVYVEAFPELYAEVLACRPGVTGLASLTFHAHEEAILAQASSATETDALYRRRCVPRKARLDLIYRRHASLCFDLAILGRTLLRMLRR